MKKKLITIIFFISFINNGFSYLIYCQPISYNNCIWNPSIAFFYYSCAAGTCFKADYFLGNTNGLYVSESDPSAMLTYIVFSLANGKCSPYNITNFYNTNVFIVSNLNNQVLGSCYTNGYYWGGFLDYNLNFSYTNNLNYDLMYEFYDPISGSNYVGVIKPGNWVNFNLNYRVLTNVNSKPFFVVNNLSNEDPPFNFSKDLDWNSSYGIDSFDLLNQYLTPTNMFNESNSQVVFTNSSFYKITQLTNEIGQTMAKVENLTDLSDILNELKKIKNNLDQIKTNSYDFDSTMAKWSCQTNSMVNTNITGLQNVLNSINSFNPNGVIASNMISGAPSSDFWKIKIPINGKDYWLKIPIDDQKVLNFFSWINSFFKLAIAFGYYLFSIYLAYKLVTDTLNTPAHIVNGAAVMGTHSNFLIAKACLAVVLVVMATVIQQFFSGLIQAPVNQLFTGWEVETSSVGFLEESFKLFLKVFPVDFFLSYLGSALAVFFNFWVFKVTLQVIKNAMA